MNSFENYKELKTIIIQENVRQFLLKNNLAKYSCIYYPNISKTPGIIGCFEYGNEWITYQTDERGKAYNVLKFDDISLAFNNVLERFNIKFDLNSYNDFDPITLLSMAKKHLEFKVEQYNGNDENRRWFEYKLNIIDNYLKNYKSGDRSIIKKF